MDTVRDLKQGYPQPTLQASQTKVALLMLLVVLLTLTSIDALAHHAAINNWLTRQTIASRRASKTIFVDTGNYLDAEDQALLARVLPLDPSAGGNYLIGNSIIELFTKQWEFTPAQAKRIRNLAISTTNHQEQYDFIRYLVEQQQLLSAGGERSRIVFGVSYHSVGAYNDIGFFNKLLSRYGYFYRDETGEIHRLQNSKVYSFISVERGCISRFEQRTLATVLRKLLALVTADAIAVRQHDPEEYHDARREFMGPDWQSRMDEQLSYLRRAVDYLVGRGVKVDVVIVPEGTWEDDLPYTKAYMAKLLTACEGSGAEIHDWSDLLDDDDFADSSHPNLNGMDKTHAAILDLLRE